MLVTVDSHEEALVVAERACTRAFIDLLLERQSGVLPGLLGERRHDLQPITLDQVLGIVSQQKNIVLSYSIAAGFLYTWLITPKDGKYILNCIFVVCSFFFIFLVNLRNIIFM